MPLVRVYATCVLNGPVILHSPHANVTSRQEALGILLHVERSEKGARKLIYDKGGRHSARWGCLTDSALSGGR